MQKIERFRASGVCAVAGMMMCNITEIQYLKTTNQENVFELRIILCFIPTLEAVSRINV
jgi:hypothetical protein